MNVYHNNNIWGKGTPETKLTALPVNQTFLWEDQEILIPAVYIGKAGAVLDVCAQISTEAMAAFLKKWDYARRISLKTPEEFEQIDADNPGSREFAVDICLDDMTLVRRMSSSIRWYPKQILRMGNTGPAGNDAFENDKTAEEWMDAYSCDRDCCWYFERISYDWNGEPLLAPHQISLAFHANFISVTAGHFSTGISCDGQMVTINHPITRQEYTLTLHGCEQTRHSFTEIGAKGVAYPEYCRILSYSITPEIDRSLFSIRDCAEGDHPRAMNAHEEHGSGTTEGPISIFMAGKSSVPGSMSAASSLHFEPVEEIRWRMVFQIKPKDDMEISFPIRA